MPYISKLTRRDNLVMGLEGGALIEGIKTGGDDGG